MFYCDSCGTKKGWLTDTCFKSMGPCEICGEVLVCNDVSSKYLPVPKQLGGGIKDIQLGGDDDEQIDSMGFK